MNAILYIRVSTVDQAVRGDHPEGFSIPAQREACRQKAKSLKSLVIDEYVDRGESARSSDRPELQRLLADLSRRKDIDYVIVHKLDRLARSLHDDVMIGLAIQKAGAKLISVMENIDDTPSGQLLHGIMATIAEFYSRNLAAEALKGAIQKAKRGGTPFRAPLGYKNVIRYINEREARVVELDPDRSGHIKWAFEQYATGDWGIRKLGEALSQRGLRSRRTGKTPSHPIANSMVHKILRNHYYAGYVKYRNVEYRGVHPQIVSQALFATVQAMLNTARLRGTRFLKHQHYLSNLLYCARCGHRLVYTQSKHRYNYFTCISRQQGRECQQPNIPILLIEEAIYQEMQSVSLNDHDKVIISQSVDKLLKHEIHQSEVDVKLQEKRIHRLEAEQEKVLQAYYEDAISAKLLKEEKKRITKETDAAHLIQADAKTILRLAKANKEIALELTSKFNFQAFYRDALPQVRRYFNQSIYERIYINDARPLSRITGNHNVQLEFVDVHENLDLERISKAILGLLYVN